MNWYEKLTSYFPDEEMKTKEHMDILFTEQPGYKKDESDDHLLIYLENEDFLFIDYILITGKKRGAGIGSNLIRSLKEKEKPIILEVDPPEPSDPDTINRIRFYNRHDFSQARSIDYRRRHPITKKPNIMDVLCWSPSTVNDQWIFTKMGIIYEQVHAYKAEELYGVPIQRTHEVLSFKYAGVR